MKQPKKIKKGEEGLKQLQEFFKNSDWSSSDYNLEWLGMNDIIDEFFKAKEDSFDKHHEMYGYNNDHDLAEGTISTLKRNDMYVRKNNHRIKRSNGGVETSTKYTAISKREDGRYEIIVIEPHKVDGNMTLHITTNLGMATEQSLEIDITKDVPKKYAPIFANAVVAINAIEDAEDKYKKGQETKENSEEEESELP